MEGVGCVQRRCLFFFFPCSSLSGVKRLSTRQEWLSLDMEYQTVNVLSTHTLHLFHGCKLYKGVQLVMKHLTAGADWPLNTGSRLRLITGRAVACAALFL